jgi:hypothetical protein
LANLDNWAENFSELLSEVLVLDEEVRRGWTGAGMLVVWGACRQREWGWGFRGFSLAVLLLLAVVLLAGGWREGWNKIREGLLGLVFGLRVKRLGRLLLAVRSMSANASGAGEEGRRVRT